MYRALVGGVPGKVRCSTCSNFADAAQCSGTECGDVKCLPCYNAVAAGKAAPISREPVIPEDPEV
jgi:hypothetical protein